jgi:hypothetical protein
MCIHDVFYSNCCDLPAILAISLVDIADAKFEYRPLNSLQQSQLARGYIYMPREC